MNFSIEIDIDAPAEIAWQAIADVERWPEWTASVTRVERLDAGPLAIGSKARVYQPGFPAAVWQVTLLEPGRRFNWRSPAPGLVSVGSHEVTPAGPASCHVRLAIEQRGLFSPLMRLFAGKTRRYVTMEAEGLKRHCESSTAATGSAA